MFGREMYERRFNELTMFGSHKDADAHEHAMRYARGQTTSLPPEIYPDDYIDLSPPR